MLVVRVWFGKESEDGCGFSSVKVDEEKGGGPFPGFTSFHQRGNKELVFIKKSRQSRNGSRKIGEVAGYQKGGQTHVCA